jgi:peptide chain release factor 2
MITARPDRDHRALVTAARSILAPWPQRRLPRASRSALLRSARRCPCSRTTFDPAALSERAAALEEQMSAGGFWDDQETAAKVSAEHARASRRLEQFRTLETDVEDLASLAEMAQDDDEIAAELEEQLAPVEARLAALEEQRLFSGRYDAGDALVTINAGAGGTDAQDWAEMVLRMEMKWAERRGFKVELLEASPGEEAGIKSATFRVEGDNAYGLYGAEKGVHRLVRLSPFDSANRRQTSFAGVEVAPVIEDAGEVEIESDDLQVDTYRASGAGGQHVNKTDSAVRITHRPSGIVVQCQNERSQTQNRETAMKMLRSKLVEREEHRRMEELAKEKGQALDVNFGSQIRSYVLHPYTMVKDHRTDHEMGDTNRVLEGDLDGFVRAYLLRSAARD